MNSYKIRKIKESEIDSFTEWALNERWNLGFEVSKQFYKDYPNGWFVGELTSPEDKTTDTTYTEIIAKLYCTKYPSKIGFIGYFIVKEKYRGKAYGYQLFKYVLDNYLSLSPITKSVEDEGASLGHLESADLNCCSAVGLCAAPMAIPFYKRFSFELIDPIIRMKGVVDAKLLKDLQYNCNGIDLLLESVTKFDLETLSKYDTRFSQAYRPGFWNNWGTIFSKDYCLVYKNPDDEAILGLGAIRPLHRGFRFGPLYASSPEIAHQIFSKLCRSLPENTTIILDVLESNSKALNFFKEFGLEEASRTGYMWKGEDRDISKSVYNGQDLYCLTSLDFN